MTLILILLIIPKHRTRLPRTRLPRQEKHHIHPLLQLFQRPSHHLLKLIIRISKHHPIKPSPQPHPLSIIIKPSLLLFSQNAISYLFISLHSVQNFKFISIPNLQKSSDNRVEIFSFVTKSQLLFHLSNIEGFLVKNVKLYQFHNQRDSFKNHFWLGLVIKFFILGVEAGLED
jgi:hypothetical protein